MQTARVIALFLGAAAGQLSEVSHAVGAPGAFCDTSVQQYAGYFNLTTGDKHYFCMCAPTRRARPEALHQH